MSLHSCPSEYTTTQPHALPSRCYICEHVNIYVIYVNDVPVWKMLGVHYVCVKGDVLQAEWWRVLQAGGWRVLQDWRGRGERQQRVRGERGVDIFATESHRAPGLWQVMHRAQGLDRYCTEHQDFDRYHTYMHRAPGLLQVPACMHRKMPRRTIVRNWVGRCQAVDSLTGEINLFHCLLEVQLNSGFNKWKYFLITLLWIILKSVQKHLKSIIENCHN